MSDFFAPGQLVFFKDDKDGGREQWSIIALRGENNEQALLQNVLENTDFVTASLTALSPVHQPPPNMDLQPNTFVSIPSFDADIYELLANDRQHYASVRNTRTGEDIIQVPLSMIVPLPAPTSLDTTISQQQQMPSKKTRTAIIISNASP